MLPPRQVSRPHPARHLPDRSTGPCRLGRGVPCEQRILAAAKPSLVVSLLERHRDSHAGRKSHVGRRAESQSAAVRREALQLVCADMEEAVLPCPSPRRRPLHVALRVRRRLCRPRPRGEAQIGDSARPRNARAVARAAVESARPWHVSPLLCPVAQAKMSVAPFLRDADVVLPVNATFHANERGCWRNTRFYGRRKCGTHIGNYWMASVPGHPLWLHMLTYVKVIMVDVTYVKALWLLLTRAPIPRRVGERGATVLEHEQEAQALRRARTHWPVRPRSSGREIPGGVQQQARRASRVPPSLADPCRVPPPPPWPRA
eukprot:4559959-Prymnesium_polylepis.1